MMLALTRKSYLSTFNKHSRLFTTNMKAITLKGFGGVDQMQISQVPKPSPKEHEILIKVEASGLNRADIAQRKGHYPPPPGESEIMGLEVSGIIESTGSNVTDWKVGDEVMALLSGGGYAEYCCIPSSLAMRIPKGLSFEEAACLPETYLTCYQALFDVANFKESQDILIHGGASGIGTSCIQLAKTLKDTNVIVTASSEEKLAYCKDLGADLLINYKKEDFKEIIKSKSRKGQVDFVLDFIGKDYFQRNIDVLGTDGTMIILAMLSGAKVENINISPILMKRIRIQGTTLRSRRLEYKAKLIRGFSDKYLKMFEDKRLKVVVDKTYKYEESQEAHKYIETNQNMGKVVFRGF